MRRVPGFRYEGAREPQRTRSRTDRPRRVALGDPVSLSEEGATPPPIFRAKMDAPMAGGAPTPVAPGEELLSITVNVSWAIKPAAQ